MSNVENTELCQNILTIRCCEEVIQENYMNDMIKMPVHLSIGEEGVISALTQIYNDCDYYGTYRSHGLFLSLVESKVEFFKELLSSRDSISAGRAGSMHLLSPKDNLFLTSAVVASSIPTAVGHAFASKRKGETRRTVVCFGDGAMDEGVFWESLNFACLHDLPITFALLDNNLAIHVKRSERNAYDQQKVISSFRLKALNIKTYNPFEQLSELSDFAEKNLKGVQFLSLPYERLVRHVGIEEDYSVGYREKPDLSKVDPCLFAKGYLGKDFNEQYKGIKNDCLKAYEQALSGEEVE